MANKKVSQLTSKPSVLTTDLFPIADPSTGQLFKTTISDLGTAIGSGVSSVNSLVGAVVLDTDDIQELVSPTNKWFTDTRARAALSASSPLTYNSGTGAFGIQVANGSQNGYLSSADWNTFNNKMPAITFNSPLFIASGGDVSITLATTSANGYLSSTDWNTFNNKVGGSGTNTYLAMFSASKTLTSSAISYDGTKTTVEAQGLISLNGLELQGAYNASSGLKLLSNDSTTGYSYMEFTNTGGGFRLGVNRNTAGGILSGSATYATFLTTTGATSLQLGANGALILSLNTSGLARFYNQVQIDNTVTATQFIRTGGTSSQFLKADGSVDSSTYLTTSDAASTYVSLTSNQSILGIKTFVSNPVLPSAGSTAGQILFVDASNTIQTISNFKYNDSTGVLTTQIGPLGSNAYTSTAYLPLAGGTLTGALSGTSATFSSYFAANNITSSAATSNTNNIGAVANNPNYNFIGGQGYWGVRTGTAYDFNIDTYNGGSYINALKIVQSGAATFSSSVTATSYSIAANGTIASNAFWGTLHTKGSGSYADWSLINSGGSGIMWNPTGTANMSFAGSIGIGTISPNRLLHINGTTDVRFLITDSAVSSTAGTYYRQFGSNSAIVNQSNGTFQLGTNDSYFLTATSSGNVGIGTTSPINVASSWTTLQVSAQASGGGGILYLTNFGATVKTQIYSDNSSGYVGTTTNHPLIFETNSSPAMRITSGGNVLIGTTDSNPAGTNTAGMAVQSGGLLSISRDGNPSAFFNRQSSDGELIRMYRQGTQVGNISVTTVLTTYNTTSDYRLKEDLQAIKGLDIVNKIKVYNYKWKSLDERMDGVLAHELAEVLPYAVQGVKDGEKMQSVDYSKIVPVLIQSIKELKSKIETLENK